MVKIQVNSQGKVYTDTSGKALVAQDGGGSTKYGLSIDNLIGDVDENGKLLQPVIGDLIIDEITDVDGYTFHYKFCNNPFITSVSLLNLTTISGYYGCAFMFFKCDYMTSASLPKLTEVVGDNGCDYMFRSCTSLTSVSLPKLSTVSGNYGCRYMFNGCNTLTTIALPELTTISGDYGCSYMFYLCSKLTTLSLPKLTTLNGSYGCQYMFSGCSKITDVYFNALTTNSFGSYKNQFNKMLMTTGTSTTHTLHFPSNLESTISGLTGYPLFGGTSGYVVLAFDLPATS